MAKLLILVWLLGATEIDDRVVLREKVTVEGRFVRLIDLVEAETLTDEARQAFEGVWLGRSPEKGKTRRITVTQIHRELERR